MWTVAACSDENQQVLYWRAVGIFIVVILAAGTHAYLIQAHKEK